MRERTLWTCYRENRDGWPVTACRAKATGLGVGGISAAVGMVAVTRGRACRRACLTAGPE